jgi:DhnA family fructose-bisphosphate aldolase class Ia
MRCVVVGRVVYDGPMDSRQINSPARAVYECETHGMPMASMHLPGDDRCPIGKLEDATEAALEKIAAAVTLR